MPIAENEQTGPASDVAAEQKQRRRMLIALVLLLVALALVLVKNGDYFFPSQAADSGSPEHVGSAYPPQASSTAAPATTPVTKPKPHTEFSAEAAPAAPPVINRAALPPLEIEVVAGDSRHTVATSNPEIKVDMGPRTPAAAASTGVNDSAQRERVSNETAHIVTHSVQPNYPVLAKQMKVQGSVILQALIGKDGMIQDLHVLSGPAILSAAAREAVKQWHFKPYYEAGQPVETEAKITVNFTISTF